MEEILLEFRKAAKESGYKRRLLSRTKEVNLVFFLFSSLIFTFFLFSIILFLELGLGLE